MKKLEHNEFIVEEVDPKEWIHAIGRLRYNVWEEEGEIDTNLFPDKVWQDKYDPISRHWVMIKHSYKKNDASKSLVASARLTVHPTLDESVDGCIVIKREKNIKAKKRRRRRIEVMNLTVKDVWRKFGLDLKGAVSNISKLVVDKSARRFGLASLLNRIRIDAAKATGASSVTSTASDILIYFPLFFVLKIVAEFDKSKI